MLPLSISALLVPTKRLLVFPHKIRRSIISTCLDTPWMEVSFRITQWDTMLLQIKFIVSEFSQDLMFRSNSQVTLKPSIRQISHVILTISFPSTKSRSDPRVPETKPLRPRSQQLPEQQSRTGINSSRPIEQEPPRIPKSPLSRLMMWLLCVHLSVSSARSNQVLSLLSHTERALNATATSTDSTTPSSPLM